MSNRIPTEQLLAEYRAAREKMVERVNELFPSGHRTWPKGATTGNWGASVNELDEYSRKELSADMVFLIWDNGNKFAVAIDELTGCR